jgi:hypothetical protein
MDDKDLARVTRVKNKPMMLAPFGVKIVECYSAALTMDFDRQC